MAKKLFLRDLARGGKAEELVSQLFSAAGFPSKVDKEARLAWDVKSHYGQTHITTEVKFDEYENRSGNVAIEVYNPRLGQPSGITATRAFFWAHCLVNKVVWISKVNDLKEYLDKHKPRRIIDTGGDKNATLWLYQSNVILPAVFTRVDTMTKDQLQEFVIEHWENAQ